MIKQKAWRTKSLQAACMQTRLTVVTLTLTLSQTHYTFKISSPPTSNLPQPDQVKSEIIEITMPQQHGKVLLAITCGRRFARPGQIIV